MKQLICSHCGSEEFITCQQPKGYAGITSVDKKITFNGQTLYHDICKHCGTVVRSYVKDVEKLS